MIIKAIALSLISTISSFALFASWKDFSQIDEGLYSAKIANRPLTLVMERVNNNNLELWQRYANVQNYRRLYYHYAKRFPKYTSDGSEHFKEVLEKVDPNKNEIWIAYVSSNEARHITTDDVADYITPERKTQTGFCDSIAMYVTITTSPNALISSHMGVSVTFEGLDRNIRGVSKDLHSFGAEVTLQRNPHRKYMINAPTAVMGSIIASAVPKGTFFAGNREFYPVLKQRISEIKEEIEKARQKGDEHTEIISMAEEQREYINLRLKRIKKQFDKQEISEERYIAAKNRTLSPENLAKYSLTADESGRVGISHDLVEKNLQEELEIEYGLKRIGPYYDLFRSYRPSLISVDGNDQKTAENRLTIFDKNNLGEPWLVINRHDINYDWVFTDPFKPAGLTFYIAVELRALAESGKAETE